MHQKLKVVSIRSLDELELHADAWDALAASVPRPLPMVSYAWISTFLQYRLAPDEQWYCLFAYEGSKLVGVLTLVMTSGKIFGFTRKIFCSPKDRHTISVDALVAPERELEVVEQFFSTLAEIEPKWYSIYFERIPASSPIIKYLDHCSNGKYLFRENTGVGLCLPTTESFDNFRASLKKSFRKNLKSHANKLNQYSDVHTEFLINENATEADLEKFAKIEVSGWKGRAGSAIAQSPKLMKFYTTLVKRLSKRSWLEWHFLHADGKTIAGNLAIRCGRSLFIWKLGYDEDFAKCSPGTLLFEEEVKYAFESDQVDMMDNVLEPAWEKNWGMQPREFHNVWIYPSTLLSFTADILPKRILGSLRQISFLRHMIRFIRGLSKINQA